DSDELRAAFGEEVFAETASAIELDEEPAEIAQLLLACLEQRSPFPAQEPRVRAPRLDAVHDLRIGQGTGEGSRIPYFSVIRNRLGGGILPLTCGGSASSCWLRCSSS